MTTDTIAFIGGGNMARSLIAGLRGESATRIVRVAEPMAAARDELIGRFGVTATADNLAAATDAAVVLLAVKPQVMGDVCRGLAALAKAQKTLWISIAAGIRMAQIDDWLGGDQAIVRAMPNTPALIGAGISGLVANARTDAAQRTAAESILRGAGATVWIDEESLMDAVTAVSGSGPAYFLLLMEALEAAGVRQGLPMATARELVIKTALGAARMADAGEEPPSVLRRRVTSPGGTTAAAIAAFDAGGFDQLVDNAVDAATRRGVELAGGMAD